MVDKISVLGDGGWGTTLAIHLANKGSSVRLWGAFPEYLKELDKKRENVKFLPSVKIPATIKIVPDLAESVDKADIIVLAVPSKFMREVVEKLRTAKERYKDTIILSVAKGIEKKTLKRMSEIIAELLADAKIAVLSGPSIAYEVACGQPTSVVVASDASKTSTYVQDIFISNDLRIYTTSDITGVELGGALKNPIAIAAGISDGLNLGSNAKASLITRGVVEIKRLGIAMGARQETFNGLSGIGDLITTCISPRSRNRLLGEQLGKGRKLNDILKDTEMVVEGVETTLAALELAKGYKVDMPITRGVYSALFENKPPKDILGELMEREIGSE